MGRDKRKMIGGKFKDMDFMLKFKYFFIYIPDFEKKLIL